MSYPNDDQFQDYVIKSVKPIESGYEIGHGGWTLFCPAFVGAQPKIGDALRLYGKGIGYPFRGIFINGVRVFYRTEAEDAEHDEIKRYGADAADWLKRWDAGDGVWSISMGGLGPGYEQCCQIVAAETLRFLLAKQPDLIALEHDSDAWKAFRAEMDKDSFANPKLTKLGLSGAQAGGGMNLALQLYRKGPRGVMTDEAVKDRHIQVCRVFPGDAE